jgi:sugar lactone lactonase YvrE
MRSSPHPSDRGEEASPSAAGSMNEILPAVPCTSEQTQLGEGARWDARKDELLRVDILAGVVFRDRIDEVGDLMPFRVHQLPGTVGAITPVKNDDGWLLAAGRGFVHLRPDGSYLMVMEVSPEATRMNDAACDPRGRFWAGALADDHHEGGGALYRLDGAGHYELMLEGLTIPNGLGWSPDGETMYLVDSGPRVIHAFAFAPGDGTISDQRTLIVLSEDVGAPDGMTVDAGGDLWVAIYGGGQVRRYGQGGDLVQVIDVPAEQTTSCAFAGRGLDRLYVTTATEGWTEERRRAEPDAGLVYRFDVDAIGRPATPFRPDPIWWSTVTDRGGETGALPRGERDP